MITRTHITAACLALAAATMGCRSNSEDAKNDAPMKSSSTASTETAKPAPAAKPTDTAKASAPAATKPTDSKSMESTKTPEAKKAPADSTPPKKDGALVAKVGEAAPAFALKDLDGKEHSLAQYKGKTVVLEWFNPHCPVCIGAYTDGSLKGMPERYLADGVVWLGINSGSPESKSNGDLNRPFVEKHNLKAPILVDLNGAVGMAYGAKTTPHMYVIDPKGVLVYAGAIDNKQDEGAPLVNYVDAAMADMKAGTPVKIRETKPYGCSVKYAKPQ